MNLLKKINVTFYSVVPSPYQRDLFYELSHEPSINLKVYYLESASPDSPWPEKALQPYERILLGNPVTWGASRFHLNWHLPNLSNTDVVVLNGYQNLTAQLILYLGTKRIPCIFWGEKMVASSSGLKGQLQKFLANGLQECAAIAAIGSNAKEHYQKRFPNQLIFNIPYYCELSQFATNVPERPRTPITILFCGQMINRKGVDLLLQAFEQIINLGIKARLLLVGREADLKEMMQSREAQTLEHIEYAGFQSPDDLPHFFRQADLFVLPSRYDGWGVVVNQALGAGLPIICSDAVGAAYDLIDSGINGDVFPNGDIDALFNILKKYLENPQLIKSASQSSLVKAGSWFPKVGAQRWVEVFDKLIYSSYVNQTKTK